MKSALAIKELSEIGFAQWGLVTSQQAELRGLSRLDLSRLSQAGVIQRVRQGVYSTSSWPPVEIDHIRAHWLSFKPAEPAAARLKNLADEVVVAGPTAAFVYQAGSFLPTPFTFFSSTRYQKSVSNMRTLVKTLELSEIELVDGLPVTAPNRTLLDLVSEGLDLESVMTVFAELPRFDFESIRTEIGKFASLYGKSAGELLGQFSELADRLKFIDLENQLLQISNLQDSLKATLNTVQYTSAVEKIKSMSEELNKVLAPMQKELEKFRLTQPPMI